jgi:hypothetical protein
MPPARRIASDPPKSEKAKEEEQHMIVLAKGSITEPDALAPHVNDEMRVVEELKSEGIMKAVYRRAAGPGVYLLLQHRRHTRPSRHPAVCCRGPHDP